MVLLERGAQAQPHFVAVYEVGRKLGQKTVPAASSGHLDALSWARPLFGQEIIWVMRTAATCRHAGNATCSATGTKWCEWPTKLMKGCGTQRAPRGKLDPIDAQAVVRAVLREPDLPVSSHDEISTELNLLVDRREVPLAPRTAAINRLHWCPSTPVTTT